MASPLWTSTRGGLCDTLPAAEIILSQPGLGPILGARVLSEFGDADDRYASAKARKNYAGTSPITRASGKKKVVMARYVHNDRLIDALQSRRLPRSRLRLAPGRTTTASAPAMPTTAQHYASSPTGSSAYCTAILKPEPSTTKQPRGHTKPKPLPLDSQAPGMSVSEAYAGKQIVGCQSPRIVESSYAASGSWSCAMRCS
jgi:hypothetical protein